MDKCECCNGTGYYGDNGPGIKGNREYQRCDQCKVEPPVLGELDTLRRQLAAANERAGRYRSALRSLVNEVGASAGAFEDEVREAVGNTNYACLMDKVEQARKALEVPDAL